MKRYKIISIALVTGALMGCGPSPAPRSSTRSPATDVPEPEVPAWSGAYEFVEMCGATAGGSPIIVEHRLDLRVEDGELKGLFSSDGFQTLSRWETRQRADRDRLTVQFLRDRPGTLFPSYLDEGEVLFTLVRNRNGLETQWGGFVRSCPKPDDRFD